MEKNKNRRSFNSIMIFSLIVCVVSISNTNAAIKGPPDSADRKTWCGNKMSQCIYDIALACGYGKDVQTRLCESSETTVCESAYGESSNCNTRPKIVDGSNKPTLEVQDAYVNPVVKGNKDLNKNTFVPNSGFVAPSPTNNGSSRTPEKPAAPMNKSLVAPLVVPTKKPIPGQLFLSQKGEL